jgi:2-oxoisovalerate dehydrogenase E1 component
MTIDKEDKSEQISIQEFKNEILNDYRVAFLSRESGIIGRKEVLTGKGKFGIFGDGKELPQIALSKVCKKGDFRSGYYRDQTWMFALGVLDLKSFFYQLYSYTDIEKEPSSGGRQMNCHFATRSIDENGEWKDLVAQYNTSSDISSTAAQLPRLLGLAYASKLYRENPNLHHQTKFSNKGNEIAFGSIGDASTTQGIFWETINAAATLQVPMVLSVWDDGYGISVSHEYQRSKQNLSELLEGFRRNSIENGIEIISVKGWDYPALIEAYLLAEKLAREEHIPVVVHVQELTQPQGHSTSGSHERYKSKERLEWEKEFDCMNKFREWILNYNPTGKEDGFIFSELEIKQIEESISKEIRKVRNEIWEEYQELISKKRNKAIKLLVNLARSSAKKDEILDEVLLLENKITIYKKDVFSACRKSLRLTKNENGKEKDELIQWYNKIATKELQNYSSHLYGESKNSFAKIKQIEPIIIQDSPMVDGRIVLRDNFDALLAKNSNLFFFGEDCGKIGDVNQGLEGLQAKYGKRVEDTGIREQTIVGQGIGMALRGLRPVAEIQYLDYVLYCIQTLSDDLATTLYRTAGGQKAPLIIRTRGHRLEGIWHSGSPISGILNFTRGMLLLVPRDFIRASGFYNALLKCDEPALIIESLNGYRLKENKPENLGEFTTPIGQVEITKPGNDITVVTYGSTWKIVSKAAIELEKMGIDVEVIDLQSINPIDMAHDIAKSLAKTNKLVVIDEDVPGGASAYILQHILEVQNGYSLLDAKPLTITAKEHRPAYSSDGDYFSKPSLDDVIEGIYSIMYEYNPKKYPKLY